MSYEYSYRNTDYGVLVLVQNYRICFIDVLPYYGKFYRTWNRRGYILYPANNSAGDITISTPYWQWFQLGYKVHVNRNISYFSYLVHLDFCTRTRNSRKSPVLVGMIPFISPQSNPSTVYPQAVRHLIHSGLAQQSVAITREARWLTSLAVTSASSRSNSDEECALWSHLDDIAVYLEMRVIYIAVALDSNNKYV